MIDNPSGEETEEEKRRRLAMEEASSPVPEDVPDYGSLMEDGGEGEVIQAPRIQGIESPETADVFQQYKDWQSRMPTRESTEPSTKRKIFAGLAGFLGALGSPEAGGRITSGILEGPRRRAMSDWEAEGASLGKVGEFAQNVSETRQKRESDVLGYEGTEKRVEATLEGVKQRRDAEDTRHRDRLAGMTEDSEKRKEVARHNKAVEGIANEANRIREISAGASKTSAEAYAKKGVAGGKNPLLSPAYRQAVMDAIGQMKAENPDVGKWFIQNPRNPSQIVPRPGIKLSPPDADRFRAFLEDARKRAKENLDIEDEDGVEDYNPLRQEVP